MDTEVYTGGIDKNIEEIDYNYPGNKDEDRRMTGLMAQDARPYFPELVYQRYDHNISKPVLMMDCSGFGILAIKAIQERQKIIEDLRNEITQIKSSNLLELVNMQQELIDQLTKRIDQLEEKIKTNQSIRLSIII